VAFTPKAWESEPDPLVATGPSPTPMSGAAMVDLEERLSAYTDGATAAVATEQTRATTAEALLAPKASPALTGSPTAPTQTALDSSTKLATTAYSDAATGVENTRALAAEALKAPLASPTLTGSPAAPTQAALDSSTKLATTAYVDAAVAAALAHAAPVIVTPPVIT
jgi:hypothetical protein